MVNAVQQLDRNSRTISSNESLQTSSTWTFAALTTGAVTFHTIFTVTGNILASVWAVCSTDVTGTGTGEVGTANNTAVFIAQTTGTAIDANEVWQNATPTAEVGAVISTPKPVTGGADIGLTIGTGTLTGGVVTFYCQWRPMSNTDTLTVATPA